MDIIKSLRKREKELLAEVGKIQQAIGLLGGKAGKASRKKHKMSKAARRKMSLAAKKRWAVRKFKR